MSEVWVAYKRLKVLRLDLETGKPALSEDGAEVYDDREPGAELPEVKFWKGSAVQSMVNTARIGPKAGFMHDARPIPGPDRLRRIQKGLDPTPPKGGGPQNKRRRRRGKGGDTPPAAPAEQSAPEPAPQVETEAATLEAAADVNTSAEATTEG